MNIPLIHGTITRPTTLKVPDDAGFGIATAVARAYDLRLGDLLPRDKHRSLAWPRQVAMTLTYELTGHSSRSVAQLFGREDHGTVLHACRRVHNLMDVEPKTRLEVEQIKARLRL